MVHKEGLKFNRTAKKRGIHFSSTSNLWMIYHWLFVLNIIQLVDIYNSSKMWSIHTCYCSWRTRARTFSSWLPKKNDRSKPSKVGIWIPRTISDPFTETNDKKPKQRATKTQLFQNPDKVPVQCTVCIQYLLHKGNSIQNIESNSQVGTLIACSKYNATGWHLLLIRCINFINTYV